MREKRVLSTFCRKKQISEEIPALNAILPRGEKPPETQIYAYQFCVSKIAERLILDRIGILICLLSTNFDEDGPCSWMLPLFS